jgi:succinoglycan biosynthesis protein ExoA
MPIRNEADYLTSATDAVHQQRYPGRVRIFMAIGPSTDDTAAIAANLADLDPDLAVIPNPTGKTPVALNLAITAGRAPVVVRVDGHSQLSSGYIQRAVETLRRTEAGNVGGLQVPLPTTAFETAVATATTSLLGTGGPSYRTGHVEASVDTVYLGVFDRTALESVGLFDEALIRNQDYELNIRLRSAGHDVVFDPELSVGYQPRSTWAALTRQYFEYGTWKAIVVRKHPGSLRLRQVIPAAATILLASSLLGAAKRPRLLFVPMAYATALAGSVAGRPLHRLRVAGVLATTHLAWGTGLIRSMLAQLSQGAAARRRPH